MGAIRNHVALQAELDCTCSIVDLRALTTMVTDPRRLRRTNPGDPEVCHVFSMHKTHSSADEVSMITAESRTAVIGCVDCKQRFAANLNTSLQPFRARRAEVARDPDYVWDVLGDGVKQARASAEKTMAAVHQAVGLR